MKNSGVVIFKNQGWDTNKQFLFFLRAAHLFCTIFIGNLAILPNFWGHLINVDFFQFCETKYSCEVTISITIFSKVWDCNLQIEVVASQLYIYVPKNSLNCKCTFCHSRKKVSITFHNETLFQVKTKCTFSIKMFSNFRKPMTIACSHS